MSVGFCKSLNVNKRQDIDNAASSVSAISTRTFAIFRSKSKLNFRSHTVFELVDKYRQRMIRKYCKKISQMVMNESFIKT